MGALEPEVGPRAFFGPILLLAAGVAVLTAFLHLAGRPTRQAGADGASATMLPAAAPARPLVYTPQLTAAEVTDLRHFITTRTDCFQCHQPDIKLVGPAFQDVGVKYLADPAGLDKILHVIRLGSEGQWGRIPMAPHPEVPDDRAREMAVWILSLAEHELFGATNLNQNTEP